MYVTVVKNSEKNVLSYLSTNRKVLKQQITVKCKKSQYLVLTCYIALIAAWRTDPSCVHPKLTINCSKTGDSMLTSPFKKFSRLEINKEHPTTLRTGQNFLLDINIYTYIKGIYTSIVNI